jgi:hypothetical protein
MHTLKPGGCLGLVLHPTSVAMAVAEKSSTPATRRPRSTTDEMRDVLPGVAPYGSALTFLLNAAPKLEAA